MSLGRRGVAGVSSPERRVAPHAESSPQLARPARRAPHVAIAFGAVLSLAHAARADAPRSDAVEANARELFRQGNELIAQTRYVDALDKFAAAYAAWPNPKIKLNLATTLRALGRNAEALRAYREYLRDGEPTRERRAEVDAIVARLEARVARVVLTLGPEVQRVSLDGRGIDPEAAGEIPVDPGRHVVITETAGGTDVMTFDVTEGEVERLALPAPDAPAKPTTNAVDATADAGEETDRSFSLLGLATRLDIDGKGRGAVGALGLVVSLGARLRASAGGLIGAHAGGWAGLEASLLDTRLTPTLGVSVPFFFVDGLRAGASAELGGRWALSEDLLYLGARVAVAHFPKLPEDYAATLVVPSITSELRW